MRLEIVRTEISTVLILVSAGTISAQQVDCRLARQQDSVLVGTCVQRSDTTITRLRLTRASVQSSLWRGSGVIRGRPLPMGLDIQTKTFRGLGWLVIENLQQTATTLGFSFRQNRFAAPDSTDIGILRRARALLSDPERWQTSDDRLPWMAALANAKPSSDDLTPFYRALSTIASDSAIGKARAMAATPLCTEARLSLFCSLYRASVDVAGEYWDDRPAMHAIRAAVMSMGRLQHPLQQFNNQPGTAFVQVRAVLDSAIDWTAQGRRCSVERCFANSVAPPHTER